MQHTQQYTHTRFDVAGIYAVHNRPRASVKRADFREMHWVLCTWHWLLKIEHLKQ